LELYEAIKERRSVRRYKDQPVPMRIVRKVLEAGTWAPSSRNRQQWRFTVLTGDAKKELTSLFRSELEKTAGKIGKGIGSGFQSCRVMEEAPVVIIVWNVYPGGIMKSTSLQSVSAAIQNMLLMAHALGLGSLWICDVFFAYDAITEHFRKKWGLVAAVTLGWPAVTSHPPSRKRVNEVSEFLS
jgi:nitroreductase